MKPSSIAWAWLAAAALCIASTSPRAEWSREFDLQGVHGTVEALLARPEGLWVGGDFDQAGDRFVANAALWNGGEWVPLAAFHGEVSVWVEHEGRVVAGGRFDGVDGTPAARIAMESAVGGWQPMGAGFEHREHPERCQVRALLSHAGRLYAGGEFTHAGGREARCLAVWDGSAWGPVSGGELEGVFVRVEALVPFGDGIVVGGEFERAGGVEAGSVAAWSAEAGWSGLAGGLDGVVHALRVFDDQLLAGGLFAIPDAPDPPSNLAAWDGQAWSTGGARTGGIDPSVHAIAEYAGELVIAGTFETVNGERTPQIARWNGQTWRGLSSGFSSTGSAFALVEWRNLLIAGGSFTEASGHSAYGIARWAGSWNPLGTGHGVGGTVYALSADADGVLAGGAFPRAGRVRGQNVSWWNGTGWVALEAGLDRDVLTALIVDGEFWIGGLFTRYAGGTARHVLRTAGGVWSSPRGGVAASVRALAPFDGEIVAGGNFLRAGGRDASRIASWNEALWNPLGEGLDDTPYALLGKDGVLIAAGRFTRAGNVPAPRIATWDGRVWSAFPAGPDDEVLALAAWGGDVVAGGRFRHAGAAAANRIAVWNGTEWRPLGEGLDGDVHAIAVHANRLVVGGAFRRAEGKPAAGLAFWDGATWNPIDRGVRGGDATVHALVSQGEALYVGGSFTSVDSVVSHAFALRSGPLTLQVWPGDCDNDGRVDGADLLAIGRGWNLEGPARAAGGRDWKASPATDWDPVLGTYADADGSGRVDGSDVLVLIENWGRDRTDPDVPFVPQLPGGNDWLGGWPRPALEEIYRRLEATGGIGVELRARLAAFLGIAPSAALARLVENPSRSWARLEFELDRPAEVSWDLLDVNGRRLATSGPLTLPDGSHVLEVDPRDGRIGSGVFYVRLRIGGRVHRYSFVRLG